MSDIDKIKKLLMLSTSDNDNEALSALRTAQSMLREAKISFLDFQLSGSLAYEHSSQYREPNQRDEESPYIEFELDRWMDYYSRQIPFHKTPRWAVEAFFENSEPSPFIKSIRHWYMEKGFLTPRQWHALQKNACEKGGY